MEKQVFVGHFFKVSMKNVEVDESYNTCPSGECQNHKRNVAGSFCSLCGSKTVSDSRKMTIRNFSPDALLPQALAKYVCMPGEGNDDAWIINIKVNHTKPINIDEHKDGIYLIEPEAIEMERCTLLDEPFVRDILSHMHATYGRKSIDLVYGVFAYWS